MIDQWADSMKGISLILAASLLLALPAFAGFKEDVARDLGSKTASLIAPAPTGSEWLIDVDASTGVQAGDLFSVIVKGSPVVNPVTKKTIGNIETVKAVLRVTKVKNGYSYAEVVSGKTDLKAGEEARRFSGLPAIFWDYAGDGEGVFTQLQGALPDLDWQGYAAAQAIKPAQPRPVPNMEPGLVFVYNDKGLGVKDQAFQPVRFYRPEQYNASPVQMATAAPTARAAVNSAAAAPAPGGGSIVVPNANQTAPIPGGSSSGILGGLFGSKDSGPGPGGVLPGSGSGVSSTRGGLIVNQMDNREGVWYGPRMEGKPVGVETGDLDGDGKNEVALCFKNRLVIARVANGKFDTVAEYSFGNSGEALTLEGVDLDGNGRMELYISLADLNNIKTIGYELSGGRIEAVTKQAPWLVRKVNLGAEGYALLGQLLNPDLLNRNADFSGPVFRVSRAGDKLERGATISAPNILMLPGFLPFEHGGQPLIARINMNDKLQALTPDGAIIWESNDDFGGSETSFERPDGQSGGMTRYAFISPRLEPGPDGTILAPVNEGPRTFSAFRQFKGSHLKAISFDGYSMVERWRTKPQGGYMADFRIADADNDGAKEIIMLVMFAHGNWGKVNYGNSALLIYEMQ